MKHIAAAAALFVACFAHAGAQAPGPSFEVVAIKPSAPDRTGQSWHGNNNRMTMQNITVRQLIKVAYHLHSDSQVVDGPDWLGKEHFDISTKMDDEEYARIDKMSSPDAQKESELLMQRLLLDRFGMHVSLETRSLPKFDLLVDGPTPKLAELSGSDADGGSDMTVHNGHMVARRMPMESLASFLSNMPETEGRVVVDSTGLKGKYNVELNWSPDHGADVADDATLPGLFTALREQLGLKVQRGEGPIPVVVVKQAEMPQFD